MYCLIVMSSKQNNKVQHGLVLSSLSQPGKYFHVFYSPINGMHRWGFGHETKPIKMNHSKYADKDESGDDWNYEFVYTTPNNIDECEDIIRDCILTEGYNIIDFVDFNMLFENINLCEYGDSVWTLNMMHKEQQKLRA